MFSSTFNDLLFRPRKKPDTWVYEAKTKFNSQSNIPYFIEENGASFPDNDFLIRIFFSHGNADDLYSIRSFLSDLVKALPTEMCKCKIGWSLKAWEYPFYGESLKPFEELTEKQVYLDALTAFGDFIRPRPAGKGTTVINVVLGHSLGCSPSLYVAQSEQFRNKVDYAILLAPFSSALSVAGGATLQWMATSVLNIRDRFPNYVYLKRVRCEVTTIQSFSDEVIPFKNNSEPFKEASRRHVVVGKTKHSEFVRPVSISNLVKEIETDVEHIICKFPKVKTKNDIYE